MTDANVDAEENAEAEESAGTGEDTDLVARVAAVDEELAAEVSDRLERAADLDAELSETEAELAEKTDRIEDLESTLKRTKADFQNYKKRTEKRKEQIKERATEDLIERLIDVRDNLVRALEQDDDADIRDGVKATLSTFDRVLEDENVEAIHPEPGTEVDPQVHEVVVRVDSDQPEGHIEDVYRPGYRMAGKVLQAAQVTVSEGGDESDEADEEATGDGAET
ncbi:MAG: nucleotide exchange factor GrpE [Halobacteriales archaeon]